MEKSETIVGIGWDVGGWQGNKQGFAVASWSTGQEVNWKNNHDKPKKEAKPGPSESIKKFKLTPDNDYDLIKMLKRVGADRFLEDESCRIVLAIDAPLGFPDSFRSFLNNPSQTVPVHPSEIENPLAFRATERWVYRMHKKDPMSPTLDFLTSNATLAMAAVRHACSEYGFKVAPTDTEEPTNRMIIETYPALVKGKSKESPDLRVMPKVASNIPSKFPVGSDQSDATICALCALRFGVTSDFLGFPKLVGPQCDEAKTEGWIYSFPADFISTDLEEG